MSKVKTTMKYIKANYLKVFRAGYCDLQRILYSDSPTYYNSGVYGWNCDVYTNTKYDIAVTTGYRNMAGDRIPSEVIQKYDEIAKNILENYKHPNQEGYMSWDEKREKLEENAENFWKELNSL